MNARKIFPTRYSLNHAALLGSLLLVLFSLPAQARPMRMWSPEELYARADFIVIGMPLEVTSTDRRSDIQAQPRTTIYEGVITRAQVEINHVIKGAVPNEITVQYTSLSSENQGSQAGAPVRLALEPFAVYVLYLRKDPDGGGYVPVLENEFDSDQSALKIAPAPDFASSPGPVATAPPASRPGDGVEQPGTQANRPKRQYIPQSQRSDAGSQGNENSDARVPSPLPEDAVIPREAPPENNGAVGVDTLDVDESQRDIIAP